MLAHFLHIFFKGRHLLFIAKDTDDIIAGNDAQLRVKRAYHLQMPVTNPIENDGVNVLQYKMFLYQSVYKLLFLRAKLHFFFVTLPPK